MLAYITWQRLKPNTTDGEQLTIETRYTSFNKADIDLMEKWCLSTYKSGIVIDAGQPIEDENRIGRWIEHKNRLSKWFECDNCGKDSDNPTNYCSNCGTKMQ